MGSRTFESTEAYSDAREDSVLTATDEVDPGYEMSSRGSEMHRLS